MRRVHRRLTRRLGRLLGLAVLSLSLSGCDLLTLLGAGPFPFDPDNPFPFPSPEATFTSGTATIELDGETITLDEVVEGSSMSADLGTNVTWTNGDGWYLTFYGYPAFDGLGEDGYLSMDRLFDSQHWVIYNPERCVTTTETSGADGVSGTAICRGLEWSDYFGGFGSTGIPSEIPGEPAFDADITFEAH